MTIRPGENTAVTLILFNRALYGSKFNTTVNILPVNNSRNFFNYSLEPANLFYVPNNSSFDLKISISISKDATDGLAVTFTVCTESIIDKNMNDFISFDLIVASAFSNVMDNKVCSSSM